MCVDWMDTLCLGTIVGAKDLGGDQIDKTYIVEQHFAMQLSVVMEIYVCDVSLCDSIATCGYRTLEMWPL